MQLIDTFDVDRRGLLGTIAALIGATALPAEALAAPRRRRRPAAAASTLTPAQFAALSAIADTIIPATDTPGAVAVGAPRIIDGLLRNWAAPDTRALIVGTIDAANQAALTSDKKPLAALTPARRKEVLLAFDKDALKPGPTPLKPQNAFEAMIMGPPVMNPGWMKLKGLVINTYYMSEAASTQELVYEHVPGQWVPSLKATPSTRPWASVGAF